MYIALTIDFGARFSCNEHCAPLYKGPHRNPFTLYTAVLETCNRSRESIVERRQRPPNGQLFQSLYRQNHSQHLEQSPRVRICHPQNRGTHRTMLRLLIETPEISSDNIKNLVFGIASYRSNFLRSESSGLINVNNLYTDI